jgi:hypothetical protein
MVAGGFPPRTKIGVAAAFALVALGSPARVRADGALPQSLGILLPADRPAELLLATTFGLIISEDVGGSWLWTCEQAATAAGYMYGFGPSPRDRLYALSPTEGLAISDDGSCSWQRAGGALDSAIANDYFVDRTDAGRVLAVAAGRDGDGGILPQSVYLSMDGGTTFGMTPLYTAPAMTNVVGIEIAHSDPTVVYAAMYRYANAPGFHPTLLRSSDGGATWTPRDVEAGLGPHEFRILAVDPDDPDLLYLRVIEAGQETLAVTRDAGATFSTPIEVANGTLSAFARLASGTVLVAALTNLPGGGGGTVGSAYRSTDMGTTFQPWVLCPQPHILGLAERGGALYLAGREASDGWALATSVDEGATVTPLSSYEEVRGVKSCQPALDCQMACAMVGAQGIWTNDVCTGALLDGGAVPEAPGPAVCVADGAADGPAATSAGGCRCAVPEPARRGGWAAPWAWMTAAALLARRRGRTRARGGARSAGARSD